MSNKVYGIYGLGMVGTSIALAIKSNQPDAKIFGFGRDQKKLLQAKRLGMIDEIGGDDSEVLASLDMFIIATPADLVSKVFSTYMNLLSEDVVVMDVSSVKRVVLENISQINQRTLTFIGAHPLIGVEKSGMEFARADLFDKKIVAIIGEGDDEILAGIRDFWKSFGAQIVLVSADFHDEIVASTSHGPHLISAAISRLLEKDGWSEVRFFGLYGKELMDITRFSQGNPEMWADIILMNADNVERALIDFSREINETVQLIHSNKRDHLVDYLTKAKNFRDSL